MTTRAYHTHTAPTSPRSTGFCAIWDCISSKSSFVVIEIYRNPHHTATSTCIEEAHEDVISNQKAEHGVRPVAKFKGIRFFDEDIGEGKCYRIRVDQFSWVGKRPGG